MIDTLPVIDIASLGSASTLHAIDEACREWGFFHALGHGFDPALSARLLSVARTFFARPAQVKLGLLRDAVNPWGYFDKELTKNRQDWKEIYDLGPPDDPALPPRWPADALRRNFEPTLRAYYDDCRALALRLLMAVVSNLGVNPALLGEDFGAAHTSFLRLNHYPVRPDVPEPPLGVGEHTDSGALTLLLQDEQPGLEVRRNGRWHLVRPLAGALLVNIGDMVQVWSNDRYPAALHRVIAPSVRDRYSAAFFLNPSYETTYEPLATTLASNVPPRYQRIHWREFRALRAAGDYADLGEEIQIAHYRRQQES